MTPTLSTTTTITAQRKRALRLVAGGLTCMLAVAAVWAHGNMTPQAVDTSTLPQLGPEWRTENPYRKNAEAIRIGSAAFNQNCARCHGLDAVSGGMAPDLRHLDNDCSAIADAKRKDVCLTEIDQYVLETVRHGRTRNGAVYMPPFEGTFSQEAIWAVKAYLETRAEQ